jgi:ketosteroid isomerase-like protein
VIALLLGAVITVSAAKGELRMSKAANDEVDRKAIEELHHRDEAASKAQNFAVLRSLMDDDAVVMEPGRMPLRGRAELDRSFAARSAAKPTVLIDDYRFDWNEVEIVGNRAIEWGRILGRVRDPQSGETQDLAFNVMRVLKRDGQGNWRIYRTIWNDSPAAEASESSSGTAGSPPRERRSTEQ